MKKLLLTTAVITGALIASAPAFADAEMKPSFANKKAGKVAFQPAEENAQADKADAAADPLKIEPAAGAQEMDASKADERSLADDMKLPRKN